MENRCVPSPLTHRTPKRFAHTRVTRVRVSVLESSGPLVLSTAKDANEPAKKDCPQRQLPQCQAGV